MNKAKRIEKEELELELETEWKWVECCSCKALVYSTDVYCCVCSAPLIGNTQDPEEF